MTKPLPLERRIEIFGRVWRNLADREYPFVVGTGDARLRAMSGLASRLSEICAFITRASRMKAFSGTRDLRITSPRSVYDMAAEVIEPAETIEYVMCWIPEGRQPAAIRKIQEIGRQHDAGKFRFGLDHMWDALKRYRAPLERLPDPAPVDDQAAMENILLSAIFFHAHDLRMPEASHDPDHPEFDPPLLADHICALIDGADRAELLSAARAPFNACQNRFAYALTYVREAFDPEKAGAKSPETAG